MASSPEEPTAVRVVVGKISEWIDRLGTIWIEGQVAQMSVRPGTAQSYLTLRDLDVNSSIPVVVANAVLRACDPPVTEGQRVLVFGKPEVWSVNSKLNIRALEIRPVGLGDLLAQIERLKNLLDAEGLFSPARKKKLPFLPRRIGLVTGRASDAMRDVVENATRRWPAVQFEIKEVAVQGAKAVAEVCDAVVELDADPAVDVIIIARGGGSVEDLLPFSNERLVRTVAACVTPVISAIGHEPDSPILDFVADVRASTPTDAAKKVVPDVAEELTLIAAARDRMSRALTSRLTNETRTLTDVRARAHRAVANRVAAAQTDVAHLRARARSLSPAATMDRGYAVVQGPDGSVIRDAAAVAEGERLRVRVAVGEFAAIRLDS